MRRLALVVVMLVAFTTPTLGATKMVPLTAYIEQNPRMTKSNWLYVISRCTALFTVFASLAPDKSLASTLEEKAYKALFATATLLEKLTGVSEKEASEKAMKTVEPMGHKYVTEANRIYTLTGNYFTGSELLEGDMEVCGTVTNSALPQVR